MSANRRLPAGLSALSSHPQSHVLMRLLMTWEIQHVITLRPVLTAFLSLI
jgi:hypothetical protein